MVIKVLESKLDMILSHVILQLCPIKTLTQADKWQI
jgi:hypothetical protein